jgi:hypothetical protein
MAALSVAYHGTNPAVPEAVAYGFRKLPSDKATQYHEHAYNMSPLAVQRILEQLMTSDTWPVYSQGSGQSRFRCSSGVFNGLPGRG